MTTGIYPTELISETSLQGYIHANFDELVNLFGEPHYFEPHNGDKVQCEWDFEAEEYRKGGRVKKMAKGGITNKKWIQQAIKKPGALKAQLGVKAGAKIPAKKLATAAKAPGKLGQRARLAQTLAKMKKGK